VEGRAQPLPRRRGHGIAPGLRALDLASGEGRNTVWLADQGWQATGVDFAGAGLAKAARLAEDRGVVVDWVEADLLGWTAAPDAFDLVIVFYLHLPGAERRLVHRRAAAALAPAGTLLVVGHDLSNLTDGYGGPQDPAVLFTPDDVIADLAGLDTGDELRVDKAERVRRVVSTETGDRTAIDNLVRAVRLPPAAPA